MEIFQWSPKRKPIDQNFNFNGSGLLDGQSAPTSMLGFYEESSYTNYWKKLQRVVIQMKSPSATEKNHVHGLCGRPKPSSIKKNNHRIKYDQYQ
jgi:hypothetical protein